MRGPSTEVLQFMSLPPCTASAATGWNDSCRTGFAPARKVRLSTAHRADAITPAETNRCFLSLSPRLVGGLPLSPGGSAPAFIRFEACSAFTHVPARMVAEPPTDLAPPLAVSTVSGCVPV